MTENLLQCPQLGNGPEEVGKQYFDDLLSRSFFQKSSRYRKCFVMHDLLNDLAKYVAGDFYFRLGVDKAETIPKMARHFSFATSHDGFGNLNDAKRLRTFMPANEGSDFGSWFCKMSISELFSKFQFLRNLSLSHCSNLTKVPDSIENLKHLRSLYLSSTSIKKLPDSTCSLYNLQILKLNSCHNLEELPLNLHKLINLRHLEFIDTKVTEVPMHLGNLKNLQVLSSFFVGKMSEFGIQQLGELNHHGRLSIGQLQNNENPSDALAAYLKNKTHLVELALDWNQNWEPGDSMKENEVLNNLQLTKQLEKLSISNYGGTVFPSWLIELSSMVCLSLADCKNCVLLPSLGCLPCLKDLTIARLHSIVVIGADFYGHNESSFSSFPSLETLKFSYMVKWETWECKAATSAFPRLQHLSIMHCPNLKGYLPEQLPHLKKLCISECKQLVALAPRAPEMHELELQHCGKLQFDYHPTTLKRLTVGGQDMEASLLARIELIISKSSLEYLCINKCPNMNISTSRCYDYLETLKIRDGCDFLMTFPLDVFPKLCQLHLKCHNLQKISQGLLHSHLKDLEICGFELGNLKSQFESSFTLTHFFSEGFMNMIPQPKSFFKGLCPPWQERSELFPSEGLSAPYLKRLCIQRLENLESLPECMHILQSLDELIIEDCPKVELADRDLPPNLRKMDLSNCSKLIPSLKGALGANTSLEDLSIRRVDVKSFPDEGLLPPSLKSLEIYNCPDLENLNYKGLYHLSSLEKFILHDCPHLESLPEERLLPKSISTLRIPGNCP